MLGENVFFLTSGVEHVKMGESLSMSIGKLIEVVSRLCSGDWWVDTHVYPVLYIQSTPHREHTTTPVALRITPSSRT